jgi:tetratricopeptide (TPR) repeat protein
MLRFLLLAVLLMTLSLVATAQVAPSVVSPVDQLIRGLQKVPHPDGKKSRWALVIGTNYGDRQVDGYTSLKLKNAENDARDVAKKLTDCFGYPEKQVIQLIGADATKHRIEVEVEKLKDEKIVGKDASVFVFFSGHGEEDKKTRELLILSHDVGEEKDGGKVAKLNVNEAVNGVIKKCDALHTLVLLDCCHAGALCNLPGEPEAERAVRRQDDSGAFLERSFQVIVAARATQKASDGPKGHSPFTDALLEALDGLGREASADKDRSFRADELFGRLRLLSVGSGLDQAAQCRRLNVGDKSGQGQFQFEVGIAPKFTVRELNEKERAMMVAMVPSTFGNWWADEIPWFIPGLREKVYQKIVSTKSGGEITREQLKEAAKLAVEESKGNAGKIGEPKSLKEGDADRLELMEQLLRAAEGSDNWDEVFETAIKKLKKLTPKPADGKADAAEPTDLHYLAVLLHKQNKKPDEARECYVRAEKRYTEMVQAGKHEELRGLWAVCLLDRALLDYNTLGADRLREAAAHLRKIHKEVFKDRDQPPVFRMYALQREGDVYRKLNLPGRCRDHYEAAVSVASTWDPSRKHLLTANTHKQFAWSHMEGWDLLAAVDQFKQAQAILGMSENGGREEAQVDRFHVRHGLAMAKRFQGESQEALTEYRRLTPDIAAAIRELDDSPTVRLNQTELRFLLADRLSNSLQRQADCSLFGHPMDLADAQDDYRRAIRAGDDLPPTLRDRNRQDWLYCRAVALALPGGRRNQDGKLEALDPQLAAHLFDQAERMQTEQKLENKTIIIRALAESLVGRRAAMPTDPLVAVLGGPGVALPHPAPDLWATLKPYVDKPSALDLTALERLMFAYAHLLRSAPADLSTLSRADDLLQLCRSALRARSEDPGLLIFLRPYFDAAFNAKKRVRPEEAKQLIEIAWEATRGVEYDKSQAVANAGVLTVYFAANDDGGYDCHLLLDAPGGLSRCFDLKDGWTVNDVLAATKPKDSSPLPLPDVVRQVLKKLDRGCQLECRWRDPCLKTPLGYTYTCPAAIEGHTVQYRTASGTGWKLTSDVKLQLVTFGFPSGQGWKVDPVDEVVFDAMRKGGGLICAPRKRDNERVAQGAAQVLPPPVPPLDSGKKQ